MPTEIITEWTTPSGSDHRSVMYFQPETDLVAARLALSLLWTAVGNQQPQVVEWKIQTSGRVLDPQSGALTGAWTEGTVREGDGNSTDTEVLPDATQMLIRWKTSAIARGRFLQGRTYLPGLGMSTNDQGNVTAGAATAIATAATTFIGSSAGFGIWSRPQGGAGGAFHPASSAAVWSEFAVLRKRR